MSKNLLSGGYGVATSNVKRYDTSMWPKKMTAGLTEGYIQLELGSVGVLDLLPGNAIRLVESLINSLEVLQGYQLQKEIDEREEALSEASHPRKRYQVGEQELVHQ